jgi:hypothetical protein
MRSFGGMQIHPTQEKSTYSSSAIPSSSPAGISMQAFYVKENLLHLAYFLCIC